MSFPSNPSTPPYPIAPAAPAVPAAPATTGSNGNVPFPLYIAPISATPSPWNITHTGTTPINNGVTIPLPFSLDGDVCTSAPAAKKKSDGCNCKKCKEFYPYAEPNQEDGTLICYQCRVVWK